MRSPGCSSALAIALAVVALAPAPAGAHSTVSPADLRALAIGPEGCAGAPIAKSQVIEGSFPSSLQGSYVLVPFKVPAGTTAVRVKYCFDQPDGPLASQIKHTLDLDLYSARTGPGALWGEREFRGSGGSSHPDVTVSAEGFSSEEQYLKAPKGHVAGKTTRGYRPGPIRPGEWAVQLGVAAVVPQSQGDSDGSVAWRVEIELSRDRAYIDQPYKPAVYDTSAAKRSPGWYQGDFHVHAEHSSLGDATMREVFDYAFKPLPDGGAGLDFITLSDYVTDTGWGEIGRYQDRYPGKLITRSAEVITYRGHLNNHASVRYIDHRTGPVYERRGDGTLDLRRPPRTASEILSAVRRNGGFTQINHPTIFPSSVPPFALLCRGCPWDYDGAQTNYREVDAIEVATGPSGLKQPPIGPNPFTALALGFYDDALASGARIAAVGSSDSHNAGRVKDAVTQAPIGEARTVVYARELSERGIAEAVRRRNTYVKVTGSRAPDLRFEARPVGKPDARPFIVGDALADQRADLAIRVFGATASGTQVLLTRDGELNAIANIATADQTLTFPDVAAGRYAVQIQRGTTVEVISSPIWIGVTPDPPTPQGGPPQPYGDPSKQPSSIMRGKTSR